MRQSHTTAATAMNRRTRLRRIALLTVTSVGVTLALAACGSATSESGGTTLVLYNAQHEQTTNALINEFTRKTGIKVRVDNNDEDVLTAKIEQEGAQSPADVIYTENSPWLQQLADKGMLAKVGSAALASVPAVDSATDGDWVGVSARVSALVYNAKDLTAAELPTSVMQLADPRWKGKIEIAPAETDFWPIISSIARTYGDARAVAWLEAVKANAGQNDNVPDNETLTSDVSGGATQLALINHYYYFRLQSEIGASAMHANIAWFAAGDAGYVEDISGAAVLKSSKHQAAAQEFVSFLTSDAAQNVLAHGASYEYPIAPGVAANPALTPLAELHPTDFTPAELGTGDDAKKLLQEAGLI
jgi:iron(III) transport system substrate-binding protein